MDGAMRGMTLIEVLAGAALLAILAGATLPWIVDARRLSVRVEPAISPDALADFADLVMRDPEDLGLPPLLEVGEAPTRTTTPDGVAVSLRRVDADADDAAHAWIVFESGGLMIARQIRLPKEPRP